MDNLLVKAADELAYLRLLIATKSVPSYRSQLRANARALWNGTWDEFQFYGEMLTTIRRNLTQAFQEGAASCGIRPNEYSEAELARLEGEIGNEVARLDPLTDFIVANSQANGGKLATVYARLELWTNAYTRVKNVAQTLACGDLKLKWRMNPLKEHCNDCRRLDGRVYRASTWAKYDIYPRKWDLECRGLRCGCVFEETDEPCTPGFPPRLSNQKEHHHDHELS